MAGVCLQMGIPEWPVLPSLADSARVVGVGFCSFTSHVLIARSLQIETAAKASAAGYLQVSHSQQILPPPPPPPPL